MSEYYKLDKQEVFNRIDIDPEAGLSSEEAQRRLKEHGLNELVERGTKSPWAILWDQLTETMVVILMVAAVISAFLGDIKDAIAILAIVIINALLGFRQEYRAEQALAALKKLAVPTVRVRRNHHVVELSARELAPGDIVLLEAGNLVPADCRLIESVNLRIQEAALTGESEPVEKDAEIVLQTDAPLADRRNMAYMGTVITYGRGQAVVTEAGMQTELGKIAYMIQTVKQEKTPLQQRLNQLGKGLAGAALGLVVIVFVLGLLRGEDLRLMFLTGISMAVAAVPEGLPAVVTIALALGAQRMLKRRALIRKLPAVETLGSVTVICSDKTGTLTENRMTVTVLDVAEHRIDLTEEMDRNVFSQKGDPCLEFTAEADQQDFLRSHPSLVLLLLGGALANDALLECDEENPQRYSIVGDPTEGALVVAAAQMGFLKEKLDHAFPRVAEVPFDSERKRMSTVHRIDEKNLQTLPELREIELSGFGPFVVFSKGAVDNLIDISNQVLVNGKAEPMGADWRRRIEEANARLAQEGMRVLGVAYRTVDKPPSGMNGYNPEQELTFVGLVGMIDPARPEVKEAVANCKTAGIRPVMITGDHPLTARYIAKELGISNGEEVLTGQDLDRLSVEDLEERVLKHSVYARVSPEHKLKIVHALQNKGQIVAMTGDGVNDAPALKKADIGVAMGITGTDVTKEAADMVLLDDNFATIVAAVEEGRTIYDNIRKFIKYTMTSNAGEIWVMLLAPIVGIPLPLLPLQILWINLVTDGLPGLALAIEPSEKDIMRRPPYQPSENIFARGMARDILWVGLLMGLVSFIMGFWLYSVGHPEWQTMVFTTLTLSQMGNALAIRSNNFSLFQIGLLSNKALLGAVCLTFVLQMAVIYVPFLQEIFNTGPLLLRDLALSLFLSTTVFWAVEAQKWFLRRTGSGEK